MRAGGVNNMKNYKIAVAGTGYVGLSIATLLSQHHQVRRFQEICMELITRNIMQTLHGIVLLSHQITA